MNELAILMLCYIVIRAVADYAAYQGMKTLTQRIEQLERGQQR